MFAKTFEPQTFTALRQQSVLFIFHIFFVYKASCETMYMLYLWSSVSIGIFDDKTSPQVKFSLLSGLIIAALFALNFSEIPCLF